MTSWLALPRFRATVSSRSFERLVHDVARIEPLLTQTWVERSLGMQHIDSTGPQARLVAPALLKATRGCTDLFGQGRSRQLGRLLRRLETLVELVQAFPLLAASGSDADEIRLAVEDRTESFDRFALSLVAGAIPDDADLAGRAVELNSQDARRLSLECERRLDDAAGLALTWSMHYPELGDVSVLRRLASHTDPEWAGRQFIVEADTWGYPVVATLSANPPEAELQDLVQLAPGIYEIGADAVPDSPSSEKRESS